MGEALLKERELRPPIVTAKYNGVEALCDMCLYEKLHAATCRLVVMSLYGSESQCRAIFAALTQWQHVEIADARVRSGGNMRYKSAKVGYGKYHAVIWCDSPVEKAVICFDGEDENDAWGKFFDNRKVPLIKEWLPKLASALVEAEYVTVLDGIGASGYLVDTSDDKICDLIVEKIA